MQLGLSGWAGGTREVGEVPNFNCHLDRALRGGYLQKGQKGIKCKKCVTKFHSEAENDMWPPERPPHPGGLVEKGGV